ncbi:hypothetical protein RRG08_016646 [Elysia crispata]|uniref:Uncharacterized protein n=1 Tax=Elysia crispata TaxID=231223 RepID=A0AAE0Z445_9GAST|nr:hypothetical protein RRG08_016646 [Elysia crispata]
MIPHNHLQNQQYEGHQHHHLQQSHLHMQSLTSPQSQPQYSGGNQQTWIPVVQSLFANANRHAMNMDSNHPPNKNH